MNFSQESCSELESSLAEELKDNLSKEKDALHEQQAIFTAQVSHQCGLKLGSKYDTGAYVAL